jgi:hypothetical protein
MKLEAAGYAVCRAAASLGAWDLIDVSASDVVLVQVKTRDWPGAAEMETLQSFAAPPNARKLVHRWRRFQRMPDVKELSSRDTPHRQESEEQQPGRENDGVATGRHRRLGQRGTEPTAADTTGALCVGGTRITVPEAMG